MNELDMLYKMAESLREEYPIGTRIELVHMGNDPNPIDKGTRGVIEFIDDIGTIFCAFDNGRKLGVVQGEDSIRKLTDEEITAEQENSIDESNAPVMDM